MPLTFPRSKPRLLRLGTLLAVTCVSGTVIALGNTSGSGPEETATGVTVQPRPSAKAASESSPSPSQSAASPTKKAASQVASASCTGEAANMRFTAAGGRIKENSSPAPSYLRIKSAKLTRDSDGVTVSYTVAGAVPRPGSGIYDANYYTWVGDGSADEPAIDLLFLDDKWFVTVYGKNFTGGDVAFRPVVQGNTVSVHLPLQVSADGDEIDLSTFTHVGWSTSGKDPSGFGLWMDGCPVAGDLAGDPGDWEVPLR